MKISASTSKMCNTLLAIYLIFISFMYYCFYLGFGPVFTLFVDTSDIDTFHNFFSDSYVFDISSISFKNIFYTIYASIFGTNFLSYVGTSFTVYLISVLLVYNITNYGKSVKFYGLLAALIYTTFPDMLLSVYGINVHISESMALLFVIYFYAKSNFFEEKTYSLLYVVFSVLAFWERESIVIYMGIILLFTTFFVLKDRRYTFLAYNILIFIAMTAISFSVERVSYFSNKIEHLYFYIENLKTINILNVFKDTLFLGSFCVYSTISVFYFVLIIFSFSLQLIFFRKDKSRFSYFIDFFVLLIFSLFLFTVVPENISEISGLSTAFFYDIFPIYAFLAISMANFFYTIKSFWAYTLTAVLFLYFLFPFNSFYSKAVNFDNEESITASYRENNYYVYTDIEKIFDSLEIKGQYENILFVVTGESFNLDTDDRIFHSIMDLAWIYDIKVQSGFSGKWATLLEKVNLPKEEIIQVLHVTKNKEFLYAEPDYFISKINQWGFKIDDVDMKLHLYSLSK